MRLYDSNPTVAGPAELGRLCSSHGQQSTARSKGPASARAGIRYLPQCGHSDDSTGILAFSAEIAEFKSARRAERSGMAASGAQGRHREHRFLGAYRGRTALGPRSRAAALQARDQGLRHPRHAGGRRLFVPRMANRVVVGATLFMGGHTPDRSLNWSRRSCGRLGAGLHRECGRRSRSAPREMVVAEERPQPVVGTRGDAVIRARRLPEAVDVLPSDFAPKLTID